MSQPLGDCPVCKKPLKDGDDIVTCPSCGAPYHRACYQQAGHCLFEDKHASGFEYVPPGGRSSATQEPGASAGPRGYSSPAGGGEDTGVLCQSCGTVNDAKNIFCENCGNPLHAPAQPHGPGMGQAGPFGGAFGGGFYGAPPDPATLNGEVYGVKKSDWASYIGASAPTYITRMDSMQRRGSKVGFMASAFLFTPAYFAYRKMWGWAVLTFVAMLVCELPQLLWLSADAGIILVPALSQSFLATATEVCYYISIAMRLLCALFALTLFRRGAVPHIGRLRAQANGDAEYHTLLVKKGGVSVLAAVGVYLLKLAVYTAFIMLGGNAFISYLYSNLSYFSYF